MIAQSKRGAIPPLVDFWPAAELTLLLAPRPTSTRHSLDHDALMFAMEGVLFGAILFLVVSKAVALAAVIGHFFAP